MCTEPIPTNLLSGPRSRRRFTRTTAATAPGRSSGRSATAPPRVCARCDRDAVSSGRVSVAVAYPGRDGAHAASAAERLFPATRALALPSFSAVVEATSGGGPVRRAADRELPRRLGRRDPRLLHYAPLSIWGEAVLQVRHCCSGSARRHSRDQVVRSHPVALDQCRRLLARCRGRRRSRAATTAEAAAEVAQRGDPEEAAIAGERAAAALRAERDRRWTWATTRSVHQVRPGRDHTRLDRGASDWRTAFTFTTDHRPGALTRRSSRSRCHGIDLVQPRSPAHPRHPVAATASTRCPGATRSTRRSGRPWLEIRVADPAARCSAPIPRAAETSERGFDSFRAGVGRPRRPRGARRAGPATSTCT